MNVDVGAVLELLSRELDLDEGEIGASSVMDDVENWDSLGHLRVCMALEDLYGVKIPMEQVAELASVQAIIALLEAN